MSLIEIQHQISMKQIDNERLKELMKEETTGETTSQYIMG